LAPKKHGLLARKSWSDSTLTPENHGFGSTSAPENHGKKLELVESSAMLLVDTKSSGNAN
jgi:hypothetical protein